MLHNIRDYYVEATVSGAIKRLLLDVPDLLETRRFEPKLIALLVELQNADLLREQAANPIADAMGKLDKFKPRKPMQLKID